MEEPRLTPMRLAGIVLEALGATFLGVVLLASVSVLLTVDVSRLRYSGFLVMAGMAVAGIALVIGGQYLIRRDKKK